MSPSAAHNRLGVETSPYLLQHAQDPVHWFAWGEEAFAAAQSTQRPILLSVGYATCHWCHVMGRESFASEEVAAVLNAHYVSIKVDREERPDVDAVYMAATQAMNAGRGGWPMTVLLTPEREPFFAGTYLPPHDRGGALGFVTLLRHVAELWARSPAQLREDATALTAFVRDHHGAGAQAGGDGALQTGATVAGDADPAWVPRAVDAACEAASLAFDATYGGFGPPPKFLATPTLRLLLRRGYVDGDAPLRPLVSTTLHGMARGGLWDWVAGGFCRYSTDAAWRVPHFEKMAYDNAGMVLTLLEAYQASGETRWASLAAQTLRFVAAEMTRPEGAFCSAIDADSEHEEGRFATWPAAQFRAALRDAGASEAQGAAWAEALGVHEDGNWEGGRNVLYAARGLAPVTPPENSKDAATSTSGPASALAELEAQARPAGPETPTWPAVRAALAAVRARRVQPITDDKVLAGQNGLLIEAFARGAAVLADAGLLARGRAAADFVWRELWRPDGLRRSWRDALGRPRGALEDYAYLARSFVALYEAGAPIAYLERACVLADRVDADFGEPHTGSLFDSPHGERHLLFRPRTSHDGATPSPAATMAWVWRRLHEHRGASRDAALAERTERALRADAQRRPEAHATLLGGCLDASRPAAQLVWLGEGSPLASPLWQAAHRTFLPHVVFAHGPAGGVSGGAGAGGDGPGRWPLLQGRPSVSLADASVGAVYVCAAGRCGPPVTTVPALLGALAELGGGR